MSEHGSDFTATQDQALAAVEEILRTRPYQFGFFYQPRDPADGDIGVTIFCQTDFTTGMMAVLAAAMEEAEPTVEPPPG